MLQCLNPQVYSTTTLITAGFEFFFFSGCIEPRNRLSLGKGDLFLMAVYTTNVTEHAECVYTEQLTFSMNWPVFYLERLDPPLPGQLPRRLFHSWGKLMAQLFCTTNISTTAAESCLDFFILTHSGAYCNEDCWKTGFVCSNTALHCNESPISFI